MIFNPGDRGPVFYREPRFSKGKRFYIIKFRVLRKDILKQVQSLKQYSRIHEKNLENLTSVGFYLKKWYLDELPQFFNILQGNMSLVGPRPWIEEDYKSQLQRGIVYRKYILAGWTGPAQLLKGHVPAGEMTRKGELMDLEYWKRLQTSNAFSLLVYDIKILTKTFRTLFEGKGIFD